MAALLFKHGAISIILSLLFLLSLALTLLPSCALLIFCSSAPLFLLAGLLISEMLVQPLCLSRSALIRIHIKLIVFLLILDDFLGLFVDVLHLAALGVPLRPLLLLLLLALLLRITSRLCLSLLLFIAALLVNLVGVLLLVFEVPHVLLVLFAH